MAYQSVLPLAHVCHAVRNATHFRVESSWQTQRVTANAGALSRNIYISSQWPLRKAADRIGLVCEDQEKHSGTRPDWKQTKNWWEAKYPDKVFVRTIAENNYHVILQPEERLLAVLACLPDRIATLIMNDHSCQASRYGIQVPPFVFLY